MRFHMMQTAGGCLGKCPYCTGLIQGHLIDLILGHLHRATSKALKVRQARVRANRNPMLYSQSDSGFDGRPIASVESAGDIRGCDPGHERCVVAHLPGAEAFAHVGIQID